MKRSLFLFVLFALLSVGGFAQSPSRILKQANKALGGEKNLQATRTIEKTGTIRRVRDGGAGKFQELIQSPNFYNVAFDLDGFETETGFNGKSGWTRDSRDGLRTLTGAASRDLQFLANYRTRRWLDYKKQKAKITAGGAAQINGKAANLLVLTTAKGAAIKIYFDAQTFLPVREEISAGDAPVVFDYADYRVVNGISEPFSINQQIGDDVYEIRLDKINFNQPIAGANFDFPNTSGAPLPDIPKLLTELQTKEDKIEQILEDYSYTQKITSRELGKDGVLRDTESQTVQLSFYKGYRIRRVIEKNGKPLTEKEQAEEDKNAQKRVAEIEREIAKKEAKTVAQNSDGTPDENNRRISIAELLRASNLVNPRRERFRGREVVVFDFEPNPTFDYKNAKSFLKFFGKTAGVMWIDETDNQVVRIEATLADNFKIGGGLLANLKKGASFTMEQERVNDEIWLPSSIDINLSVKVLLVKGISVNQNIKSYNYRKFKTEVEGSQVNEVKQ